MVDDPRTLATTEPSVEMSRDRLEIGTLADAAFHDVCHRVLARPAGAVAPAASARCCAPYNLDLGEDAVRKQRAHLVAIEPFHLEALTQGRQELLDGAIESLLIEVQRSRDVGHRHRILEAHLQNQPLVCRQRLAHAFERGLHALGQKVVLGTEHVRVRRRRAARHVLGLGFGDELPAPGCAA